MNKVYRYCYCCCYFVAVCRQPRKEKAQRLTGCWSRYSSYSSSDTAYNKRERETARSGSCACITQVNECNQSLKPKVQIIISSTWADQLAKPGSTFITASGNGSWCQWGLQSNVASPPRTPPNPQKEQMFYNNAQRKKKKINFEKKSPPKGTGHRYTLLSELAPNHHTHLIPASFTLNSHHLNSPRFSSLLSGKHFPFSFKIVQLPSSAP